VLRSDESESASARDRVAELNAVPGLVDIMHDFLDAHDDVQAHEKEKTEKLDGENGDVSSPDAEANVEISASLRSRLQTLEPCVADALRCLIDLTRTVATRLRVVDAGGIGPVCRLMDADVFPESIAERAVVLLINCAVGEDIRDKSGSDDTSRDDPFSPAAKVRKAVAQTGGVGKIVSGLRRSPKDPAGIRAVHLLSLVADDPATRTAFLRDGDAEASFRALTPFLSADVSSDDASSSDELPVFVKHAAVAANGLCVDDVPLKEAFMRAGGIPPLMALLGDVRGKGKSRSRANGSRVTTRVVPVITKTVVDAVSTLAMDTDATDQAICDTGVLPFLVQLIGDPRCDKDLSLAAVHAVMHMARDSRDAKRQLTEEGVVGKMRDIVEAYDKNSAVSEQMVVPAVSCLVNLAVDTEYWGQAELASERVMEPVKRAFDYATPRSKFAQVCVAFTHAFVKNNPDNGFEATDSGVLPVLAYHHLRSRDRPDKTHKRAAKEALVTLGAAVDADESAREVISSLFGDILLRECLVAGAGAGSSVPPTITDTKRLAKEKATLVEVMAIAREAKDGAAFARAADGARLARKKKRAQEIFDAEAALEKKLVQQLAAREKELAEAEAARVELRKAQARVGQALNAVKKEVNEARAAKKDLEAAQRALARKIEKEGAGSKAAKSLAEIVEHKKRIYEKEQREADEAIAAQSREEAGERAARASFEREKAEADAAEKVVEEAAAAAAARKEKLDNMDVRARRRFIEQEEAAEAAAKKAARAAARAAERIANGEAEDVDLEAAEVEEEEEEEEEEEDPFEKKCCVVM